MTQPFRPLLAALALFAGGAALAVLPNSASAAQSYDNCTGFIDSLPATISTQGVWCLNKHLNTGITDGNAITIAANNVTIDCNDFKVGGLAAGDASNAHGIYTSDRQNATVRNCSIRGFNHGINFRGGAGHLIEDNRFDNNLEYGIYTTGSTNNLVQRNRVYDTGGHTAATRSVGIAVSADLIDNIVAGVFAASTNGDATGIRSSGSVVMRNNRVRGLQASGAGYVYGVRVITGSGVTVDGNQVSIPATTNSYGILGNSGTVCSNNVIAGFNAAMTNCVNAGGNTSL